ncbi:MAG: type III pantothenate kinase [Dehalococcoidia bacterium]
MLAAIDIGNTNITLGVFDGETLRARWRIAADVHKQTDEYIVLLNGMLTNRGIDLSSITDSVLCSVVPPLTTVFQELCQSCFGEIPLVVDTGVKTGMKILYENPRDVGADRVADAVAAFHKHGGPVIVVDCGTGTVFDAISKDGDYLGGAIAPGIDIAAEALFERASKLPRIDLTAPDRAIGRNTVSSMQSGLIFGYVSLIEGLVSRFQEELGNGAKVVATGGLAATIAEQTDVFHAVDPDLTLEGLRLIHEMNKV